MKINSSFWYDDLNDDDVVLENLNESELNNKRLIDLAASKRAISNFVSIVTNEQIPVVFKSRGDSFTDGKQVTISSKFDKLEEFDVAVGLALHEGSHIKLSDFEILPKLPNLIPTSILDLAEKLGIWNSIQHIKNLTNWVEDRRIDHYIFTTSPGYRDYYRAMYDKYFNDKLIDKALQSSEYTNVDVDSYMFRIMNLTNENSSLKALPNLDKIYKIIDLKNINRLPNTTESFHVALQIWEVILDSIANNPTQSENSDDGNDNGKDGVETSDFGNSISSQGMGESTDSESDDSDDSTPNDGMVGGMADSTDGESSLSSSQNSQNFKPTTELTHRQKSLIDKKIKKQKDFLEGDIAKRSLSKKDVESINSIEESGTIIKNVEIESSDSPWKISRKFDVIVVKNLTMNLVNNSIFPMSSHDYWKNSLRKDEEPVLKGIRLGRILGKKLQLRSEERNTVFNRQRNGKIDKRMIASLGFGNENVFQYLETDTYKKANLHLSIDASGSMAGKPWSDAITNAVALAQAVDMIPNLNIQISFRTTESSYQNSLPYIVIAYDSRKDKISKIKKIFPYLEPTGTTPESLCFESIIDEFVKSNNDLDSYFVNISDGAPNYRYKDNYYGSTTAINHTQKTIKKIKAMGIKVISYYVTDYGSEWPTFKSLYGSDSRKIDVTNMSQISRTLNKIFLEK